MDTLGMHFVVESLVSAGQLEVNALVLANDGHGGCECRREV
jgi:hypothetical protein